MAHVSNASPWRLRTLIGGTVLGFVALTVWLGAPRADRAAAREDSVGQVASVAGKAATPSAAELAAAQIVDLRPGPKVSLAARPGEGILPASFVLGNRVGAARIDLDHPRVGDPTRPDGRTYGRPNGPADGRPEAGPVDRSPDGSGEPDALSPWVNGRVSRGLSAGARFARAALPMGLQQSDLIEFQPFEDEVFPPEGWGAWDRIKRRQGNLVDIDYTWGRETCDLDEQFGYDYAVWSSGGGAKGSLLTPCKEYPEAVSSRLFYDRLNTVDYPGGLTVNFTFKLDVPVIGSFVICAPIKDDASHYQCFWPLETDTEGWKTFPEPIAFTSAAGLTGAEVVFAYEDLTPDGTHIGVYLDNVDIEAALTVPGAPTLTPSVTPTDRPTRTPSNTPVPTKTLLRPATNTPPPTFTLDPRTPTVTPLPKTQRYDTFMPLAYRALKDVDRYQPVPLLVWAQFGTSVNPETGAVTGLGRQFANGTAQVCAKIEWSDVGIGSRVGWTWQYWDAAKSSFADLTNDPPFKDQATIRAGNQTDFTYQCLRGTGPAGAVTPGTYRVLPFINGQPEGEQFVAIVESPGAGGSSPTPPPPTPTPTAEPTDDPGGCRQRIENGGFEEGPGAGWGFRSTSSTRTDLSQIIIKDPVAFNSQWLAMIGGEASTTDELHSLAEIPLLDTGTVLSATLAYLLRVTTDEAKDGRIDDTFIPTWVSQEGRNEQLVSARITDEMLQEDTWFDLSYPVTDRVVKRGTWTSMHLSLVAKNSAARPTTYKVDNVRLTICRKPAWMNVVAVAAAGPLEASVDLLRPLIVRDEGRAACDVIPLEQ